MAEPDFSLLSDKDLLAIKQDRWDQVSDTALKYLKGEEIGAWDAFTSNASRAFNSSLEGIAGALGGINEEGRQIIQQKESEARMAAATNPVAAFTGSVTGNMGDIVTLPAFALKPLTIAGSALKTGALRGAAAGTFGGVLQPVFEEFDDSRLKNIAYGAAFGGTLGGAAGALLKKFGIDISADPNTPEGAAQLKEKLLALPNDKKEQLLLEWNGERDKLPAPEKPTLLGYDGTVTREDPSLDIPEGKKVEWNNDLKMLETVEEAPSTVDINLPPQAKSKIKINKVDAEFDNDIDHAFYQVNQKKGVQSQAAEAWLMEKTGMGQREVQDVARKVASEVARRVGTMQPENGKLKFPRTMLGGMIKDRVAPTRTVRTPLQPKRIDVKDGLDPSDLQKLEMTGVSVSRNPAGEIRFRDKLNGNKFISAIELKNRLNSIGVDLDVPGYREKVRAAQSIPKEEVAKVAEDAPVIKQAEAAQQAADVQTGVGERIRIPKAKEVADQLDVAPEDIGIPKPNKSAGSAGVDPKQYLSEDLMPKTARDVAKGGETRERVLLKMLENDDPRVAAPKDVSVKNKATFTALKLQGAKALKNIINKYGNMAEFIVSKKGDKTQMNAEEVVAFRWFYADAMANRAKVLNRLQELHNRSESLDSPEAAELARDIVYYTGIDLFYKEDGMLASRAMNARRIIAQTLESGSTPNARQMKGIFPGGTCQ